ncbi:MAG: hypothetical protein IJT36_07150 [Alphaproteobacteria bacterium]|nr:hypothetical protein [Alphaproteobacteria bacterium]
MLPDPKRCKNSVEQNKNELFPAKCASRSCKSSAERNAVISLIALIQKQTGIKIDDVRFIDALSLTNSLFEEGIKSEALQELENGDVDSNTKFILDHISKYEFSSEPFKESLLRLVANGCKESKIFRDCLIADIAKINSTIPKPIKRFTMGYPHFEFIESDFHSYNLYGIIKLTCDRDHVYMQTFFDSSSTVKHMGGGIYAAEYGDFQPMHHEIGHFSSASYIKYLAIFDMDETMQLIAKLIVGEKFDQNAFDQTFYRFNSLFIEAPDGIRKQLIEGYLHRHRHTFHDCNSLDEAKEQITKAGSSKEGIAKLAFLNYGEILQILGLSLINYNGHHTLVINLLSDFALSVELGLPIRSDHTSYGLNPIKETYKYILPDTSYAIHSINFEFYGAMLEIYGSSMQQYTLRLMYGNSMFPILNAEQKLGQEYLLKKALKNNLISIEINDDVNI